MRVVHTIMCLRASKRLMTSTKVDVEQTEANGTIAAFPASEPETAEGRVGVGWLLKGR